MADGPKKQDSSNDNALGPLDFGLYSSFLAYQSPLQVSWIAAAHGVSMPPREGKFTYVQLGAGPAFALAVLAASYPDATFIGLESDAATVERAQRLAGNAGLTNLEIRLAPADTDDLPKADILTVSTILSWMSAVDRTRVTKAAHRALNENGILCVQYAALPGNAAVDSLYTLLRQTADTLDGDAIQKLHGAVQKTLEFARGGAMFFNGYPLASQALQGIAQTHPALGVHEVFHSAPHAFYHHEIRAEMAAEGFAFAGSGQLDLNHVELAVPIQARPSIDAARTPELRELLIDFARNQPARADLYVKGMVETKSDLSEALSPFALVRFGTGEDTLGRQQLSQQTGIDLTAQVYTDLLRALEGERQTVGQLLERADLKKHARPRFLKAIQLAVGLGLIALVRKDVSIPSGPLPDTLAMNGALNEGFLENNLDNPENVAFAAPVTGLRALLSMQERWLLHAALGGDLEPVFEGLKARGLELKDKDGVPASAGSFARTVNSDVPNFRRAVIERLYRIGVLKGA